MKYKTQEGIEFDIDKEWLPLIKRFKWYAIKNRNQFYIRTSVGRKNIKLHRLLLGLHHPLQVDHKNRIPTDNRVKNLRYATASQNIAHNIYPTGKSGYRGVHLNRKKWMGQYCYKYKSYRKCGFSTPEAAARWYDKQAKRLWGEFAVLNFPKDQS